MAKALDIIKHTILLEGGISSHKNDTGRLTYKGISRFYHPSWSGWTIILKEIENNDIKLTLKKDRLRLNIILENNTKLQKSLFLFYLYKFWNRIKGDSIISNAIAKNIFDFSVNSGPVDGCKAAQKVAQCSEDGIIGPISLKHINSKIDIIKFILEFNEIRIKHFYNIVISKPNKKSFLFGWCNRIIKLIEDSVDLSDDINELKIQDERTLELFNKFQKIEIYLKSCWDDADLLNDLDNQIKTIFEIK